MRYRKSFPFTLIEILVVIGIIMILAGFLLPALYRAKFYAKYMRWFAYNKNLSSDPRLIINYNFHERGFAPNGSETVYNRAEGCTIAGYKPKDYHGNIKNFPVWRNQGGRWMMHNKTMVFDGANDYIEVDGTTVFETSTGNNDFTAICWVNFDELSGLQTVASKSIWPDYSQFVIYAQDDTIKVEIGSDELEYTGPDFQADRWVQVAVVNKSSEAKLYINGAVQDSTGGGGGSGKIVIWHVPKGNPGNARVLVIAAQGWNGHKNRAPDSYIISNDADAYFASQYSNDLEKCKLTVGAAGYLDGTKSDFFKGKIDEVIYIKRGMKRSEVEANFEMGDPY